MEAFLPDSPASSASLMAERLPFDIVRALVSARQAATPTAHALAEAVPVSTGAIRQDSGEALMVALTGHGDAMTGGARFAACSIGRVAGSAQEVSA